MLELGDRIWLTKRDGVSVNGWRKWQRTYSTSGKVVFGFGGPCGNFLSIKALARLIAIGHLLPPYSHLAPTLCVVEQLLGSGEIRI